MMYAMSVRADHGKAFGEGGDAESRRSAAVSGDVPVCARRVLELMAFTIMGGLALATMLTVFFLPGPSHTQMS